MSTISPALELIGIRNYDLCFAGNDACITFPCQDITVFDKWNKAFLVLAEMASNISFRAVKKVKDCMVVEIRFPVEIRDE